MQEGIAAQCHHDPHRDRLTSPSVATITALIVCIRFSAWSKTIDRSDSNTSFVTSIPSMPNLSKMSSPTFVSRSWNAGRQCMNFTFGLPVRLDEFGVDLVRLEELDPLVPDVGILAHRDPYVRVEEVDAADPFVNISRERETRSGLVRDLRDTT